MRPDILNPLFAPVSALEGVGPKIAKLLEKLLGSGDGNEPRIVRLVTHLPHALIDRRKQPGIAFSPEGTIVTLKVRVDRHQPSPRGKPNVPYRVFVHDDTGELGLTFFHMKQPWIEKSLPVGETVFVSGKMEWFNGRPTMVHPDYITPEAGLDALPLIEPVYGMTEGLSPKTIRKAVHQALQRLPVLAEWQDEALKKKNSFRDFRTSLEAAHILADPIDIDPQSATRRRLAYDELLAGQLSLAMVRSKIRKVAGKALVGNGHMRAKLREAIPYELTGSQEIALSEIALDLEKPDRMLRLLQGDVGSGKTIVALMAMAQACEAGGQSVLLAPTEVLARQHYATIAPLAAQAGLRVVILTGNEKGQVRADILMRLLQGDIDILIGTHAVFQEAVAYKNLVFAVVDEQHRFGVHQRLQLAAKGQAPHLLVMTATPIPRTLVLTAFGEMDVSKLTEKPAGRKPIVTVTIPMERIGEIVERIAHAVDLGGKAYWICPLVEETEEVDATAAVERFGTLEKLFGQKVDLVHGRMTTAEKDKALNGFRDGLSNILVATTVVEVGVDVPDATIMVIEHAERFGLAQLHQLRGRVGRGDKPSTCVLLYKGPLGEVAHARLAIMRETEDGFRIAEEDLRLRGEGELLGTRQSGMPAFRMADLSVHGDLLETARKDARYVVDTDPELVSPRGEALRTLLYFFERDEAVRLLRAG
jgi:ATP-dependent DNA helicase RecG